MSKSNLCKEFALAGQFSRIRDEYGSKAFDKCITYIEGKLEKLRSNGDGAGEDLSPFIQFALNQPASTGPIDIFSLANAFETFSKNVNEIDCVVAVKDVAAPENVDDCQDLKVAKETDCIGDVTAPDDVGGECHDNTRTGDLGIDHSVPKHEAKRGYCAPSSTTKKTSSVGDTVEAEGALVNKLSKKGLGARESQSSKTGHTKLITKQKVGINKKVVEKKEKKKRAPMGKSAFIFFSTDVRKSVVEELGEDASFAQVGCEIGKRWKEMDDDEKEKYVSLAALDKERVADLLASGDGDTVTPKRAKKATTKKTRGRVPPPNDDCSTDEQENTQSDSDVKRKEGKNFDVEHDNNGGGEGLDFDSSEEKRSSVSEGLGKQVSKAAFGNRDKADGFSRGRALATDLDTDEEEDSSIKTPHRLKSHDGDYQDEDDEDDEDEDSGCGVSNGAKLGRTKRVAQKAIESMKHQSAKKAKRALSTSGVSSKSGKRKSSGRSDDQHSGNKLKKRALPTETRQTSSTNQKKKPFPSYTQGLSCSAEIKGIKQEDLSAKDDLLHCSVLPRERIPFPRDFVPRISQCVVLVLEPYRDFVSSLPEDALSPDEMEAIQLICDSPEPFVQGIVVELRKFSDAAYASKGNMGYVLTVSFGKAQIIHEIAYAPFSSSLLVSDVFLLDVEEFKKSLKKPWLTTNAQVCRAFATDDGSALELHEGSIYSIREDMELRPFKSISVVWMEREENADNEVTAPDSKPYSWVYKYMQTECECSPWDMQPSKFVLPDKLADRKNRNCLPRSLSAGPITVRNVLEHLKSLDFSYVFKYRLGKCSEFVAQFPMKEDHLDFHSLAQLNAQGKYDIKSAAGFETFFADLLRMVANGKQFNECNRGFQPWRMIDMMEAAILELKPKLAIKLGHQSTIAGAGTDHENETDEKGTADAIAASGNISDQHVQTDDDDLNFSQRANHDDMFREEV